MGKKLVQYPPQAMNYLHEGQMMVLLSNDIEKISNTTNYLPFMAVSFIFISF